MTKKLAVSLFIAAMTAASLAVAGHLVMRHYVSTSGFHKLVVERLSEMLGAEVQVGRIEPHFLNRVTLSRIQILPDRKSRPLVADVESISFRYSILQFLTRQVRIPAIMNFEAPSIVLKDGIAFDQWFTGVDKSTFSALSNIRFNGGSIYYPVPSLNSSLMLKNLRGGVRVTPSGLIELSFSAMAQNLLEGEIRFHGRINPRRKTHSLVVDFQEVRTGQDSPLQLDALNGSVRYEDSLLIIGPLHTERDGWESVLEGAIRDLFSETKPSGNLNLSLAKDNPFLQLRINSDLQEEIMNGQVSFMGGAPEKFEGNVSVNAMKAEFAQVVLGEGYVGGGQLDFQNGNYHFDFAKGVQRISLDSSLRRLNFDIGMSFDHMDVYGLDIVTKANVSLAAIPTNERSSDWEFQGRFQTDYFILEQTPLANFNGEFRLGPYGIQDLHSEWSKTFSMVGNIPVRKGEPDIDLEMHIDGFDIGEAVEFAGKPLPEKLLGTLEGKVRLRGAPEKPEVMGSLSVKSGSVGRLDYDRALIYFRGYPPYFPLEDSKILKGRMTFSLTGALDLSLENMLAGVRVETADKVILWRGLTLNTSQEERNLEFDAAMARFPTLSLLISGDEKDGDKPEDSYIAVGPKVKF